MIDSTLTLEQAISRIQCGVANGELTASQVFTQMRAVLAQPLSAPMAPALPDGWVDISVKQPSLDDSDEDGFIWAHDWAGESVVATHISTINNVRQGDEPIFDYWMKKQKRPAFDDTVITADPEPRYEWRCSDANNRRREDAAVAELVDLRAKFAALPADWSQDSSLETWFPYTAQELDSLRAEAKALRVDAERWRHARKLFDVDAIENCQAYYEEFCMLCSEQECVKADTAIDAARLREGGE